MEGPVRSAAPDRELLLANHSFPGEYIVKAFGPGTAQFRGAVVACATSVVEEHRVVVSERSTKAGRRMCVTLTLHAHTVDEVIDIYEGIHQVPELMLIL